MDNRASRGRRAAPHPTRQSDIRTHLLGCHWSAGSTSDRLQHSLFVFCKCHLLPILATSTTMKFLSFLLGLICVVERCHAAGIMDNVVFAVNCGGEAYTDSHGIRFRKDYLRAGITSDYGRNSIINRVSKDDMILYQTERYDLQQFSYEIDVTDDGDYVLWMKFAEVWFNGPNMKVETTHLPCSLQLSLSLPLF